MNAISKSKLMMKEYLSNIPDTHHAGFINSRIQIYMMALHFSYYITDISYLI